MLEQTCLFQGTGPKANKFLLQEKGFRLNIRGQIQLSCCTSRRQCNESCQWKRTSYPHCLHVLPQSDQEGQEKPQCMPVERGWRLFCLARRNAPTVEQTALKADRALHSSSRSWITSQGSCNSEFLASAKSWTLWFLPTLWFIGSNSNTVQYSTK